MSEHNLRNRTVVDYSSLHSGSKSKNSLKYSQENGNDSQNNVNQELHSEISDELHALEIEEARLKLEIALAEKKREISVLQSKLQKTEEVVSSVHTVETVPQTCQKRPGVNGRNPKTLRGMELDT